jgi:hypothetical protein
MSGKRRSTEVRRPGSLVRAVQTLARKAGLAVGFDDLHAAMGLSWLVCAVREEPDLAAWPMAARDVFLPEALALWGLRVRDLHPPSAARGLERVGEFTQHFEASYRPLILRALEHRQPVLAWRGWPGEAAAAWGLIERTRENGAGFSGQVYLGESGARGKQLDLVRPPVQVYVVEAVEPKRPREFDLVRVALDHARRVLTDEPGERWGIVCGPGAYTLWQHRLTAAAAEEVGAVVSAHAELAEATAAAHRSAIRFLNHHLPPDRPDWADIFRELRRTSDQAMAVLEASTEASQAPSARTIEGRAALVDLLTVAETAAIHAGRALTAFARGAATEAV